MTDSSNEQAEFDRIRNAYVRRAEPGAIDYSRRHAPNLFFMQSRQRHLRNLLQRDGVIGGLPDARVLEAGCGDGMVLHDLEAWDIPRQQLAGIDLREDAIEIAKQRLPGADLRVGSASALPWDDGTFDIVMQFTMFTSILDPGVRAASAAEMLRVLKPDGCVVWYDFAVNNPRNPDVRRVTRREIRSLFPGCRVRARRITLAPPIARWLAPKWWLGATLLESLRVFNTHELAVIRRR